MSLTDEVRKEYVRCRTVGHSWDPLPHTPGKPELRLRCTSCTMERFDIVEVSTGEVRGRRYDPPRGYYLSENNTNERPSRSEWRKSFLVVAGVTRKNGRLR